MKIFIAILCLLAAPFAQAAGNFQISSPAFKNGGFIPREYSRTGGNKIPPLTISGVPEGAKALALLMEDPDSPGGDWVHWLICNLPSSTTAISSSPLPENAIQGSNSWHAPRYDGPQPPAGTHRYVFHLYALDAPLLLKTGFHRADFEKASKGRILAETELVGKFSK